MPMHTSDTRLQHLDCLKKLGWLGFDVTHMGDPDGYLLSPCCEHGYRATYGPRAKLDWERAKTGMTQNQDPSAESGGNLEGVWNWSDAQGGDQASFFTHEQRMGNDGSWVLVAGATQTGDGPPIDADAKWWATSQSDVDTIEEELVGAGQAGNLGTSQGSAGNAGNWLGQKYRTRHEEHWHHHGGMFHNLRRWTKAHENSAFTGHGAGHGIDSGGIPDPGLGESSGLPDIEQGFAVSSVWWIKYGNRAFLGLTKCIDPLGANQERDDHGNHGVGSNWRGLGLDDFDITGVVSPGASAAGGYVPKILFWGGEIIGAQGDAITDASGQITGIEITDPGVTVVTDVVDSTIEIPNVSVSMPHHYKGFEATALVSTELEDIKAALPGVIKSKSEMMALICDGYNDPIAQTFLVNGLAHPDGVFVPHIDICFQSKPQWGGNLPVFLEIRPTINGFPHSEKLIASKMLYPNQVRVASGHTSDDSGLPPWESPIDHHTETVESEASDAVSFPNFDDEYAYTRFEFDYPQYLEPGEYAIVVRSNDSSYRCWIADTRGEAVVGDNTLDQFDDDGYEKVSGTYAKQYGGSFFRSQNGRTWSPDQWQDLMFRVNQCVFGGTRLAPETGDVKFAAGTGLPADFEYDRLKLNMFSALIPNRSSTKITGTIRSQKSSDTEGTLSDLEGGSGTLFSETEETGTRDMPERMKLYAGKTYSDASFEAFFKLSTTNPDVSPVIDARNSYIVPIQNIINSGGLRAENINISAVGSNYTNNDRFQVNGGGSTETAYFKVTVDGSNKIASLVMCEVGGTTATESGKGFHTSKDILVSNAVSPSSASAGGSSFEILSEEGQEGGNAKVRYITRSVTLAAGMTARGIRVYLTAQQPYGSRIYVYHKILAEEDAEDINRKKWKLMSRTTPDEDFFSGPQSTFASASNISGGVNEYVFDSDEIITYTTDAGVTYDSFRTFAVKIVTMADNYAQVPVLNSFRAIAVF